MNQWIFKSEASFVFLKTKKLDDRASSSHHEIIIYINYLDSRLSIIVSGTALMVDERKVKINYWYMD